MYNEDIIKDVIAKFGVERAIEFCEIEAFKYNLQLERDHPPCSEYSFERDWWKTKKYELLLININEY